MIKISDADLAQRRQNLEAKQAAMKEQMMREGSHLFCGKKYYNSSHGSMVLRSFINKLDEQNDHH